VRKTDKFRTERLVERPWQIEICPAAASTFSPAGLDQEIACIMRLIAESRARSAAVSPTIAATEKFLARLGTAFPGTVWVGGCKNWYTSQQPTPVLWPFPQSEHKAFFERVPMGDFQFARGVRSSRSSPSCRCCECAWYLTRYCVETGVRRDRNGATRPPYPTSQPSVI
jgi:hypothetical protein